MRTRIRRSSAVLAALVVLTVAWPATAQEQPPDPQAPPEEEGGPVAGERPSPIPGDAPAIRLERIASGFAVPIHLTQPDDGTDRLFVVDQTGTIHIVEDGRLVDRPFLDLSDRLVDLEPDYDERGLLGLAFHPDYAENGRLFVYYSAPLREQASDDWDHTSHLSEFRVSEADPNVADPNSHRLLLAVDQPYSNHNAGTIAFGRDGYLYVPLGDGGNANDVGIGHPPLGNGQDITTILGSILRLDVDSGDPYRVPPDNPFVGGVPLPDDQPWADDAVPEEIWAYGFRNPYALSVDRQTGEIYIADAGQDLMEHADLVEAGGNHGWNIVEGTLCFDPEEPTRPPEDCPDRGPRGEPIVTPIAEYERGPANGNTIVAAVRYRGELMPEYRDALFLADYSRIRYEPDGVVFLARPQGERPWEPEPVRIASRLDDAVPSTLGRFVIALSQDLGGELYLLTTRTGGPRGSSGEVFAVRSAAGPGETGTIAGLDPSVWWIAFVIALAAVGVLAIWFLSRRRVRPDRSPERGHPTRA